MQLDETLLSLQPVSDLWTFMILGVIRDEVNLGTIVVLEQLVEKGYKGIGVEPVHQAEMPLWCLADLHCAYDLCALADRRGQHVESLAYRSPTSVYRAGLLEACFIPIHCYPFLLLGFFLYPEELPLAIPPGPFRRPLDTSWSDTVRTFSKNGEFVPCGTSCKKRRTGF